MNEQEHRGRVALVTGGSGGIGSATARTLSAQGARVAVVGNDRTACEALASELANDSFAIYADLRTAAECRRTVAETLERAGRLDILVNSAGIAPMVPIPEVDDSVWDDTIAVNLKAVFFMCQAAVEPLSANGWGRIINISSVGARTGGMGPLAPYCAAKAGVLALTKSFATYLGKKGVTVNAVAPGPVRTAMTADWDPDYIARVESAIVGKGRFAEPQEIADAIAFLASDRAGYMTGSTLDVNAGLRMD